MIKRIDNSHKYHFYGCLLSFFIGTVFLATRVSSEVEAIDFTNSHLGTFEGNTTYQLSSETGILPTLELELKNQDGTIEHYKTSSGTLNLKNTRKGATVKSAILTGQTLVNLAKYELSTSLSEMLCYQDVNLQKNNTAYTLFNLTDKPITFNTYNTSSWRGFETVGANSKRLLTLNDFTINEVIGRSASGWDKTAETEKFLNGYMIIEGNYTSVDIPYFNGMQSVKMPVLRISNQDGSQTATISTEEEITLRSNGEVYDELDLMTGKFTQRIGEDGTVLSTPKIRILKLKTDSIFESIKQAEVDMVGTIDATIASVTLPTAPLTFRINPNLPTGQQFIASDFSITNNSQAPLTLELKEFVQTTDVLEDVHPDFYENWENLTKDQSKKIALGLVPQDSENWLTLQAGPYYVAETQNALLGHIKSNSTVDFTFTALHGQSFNQLPNPQYRLTFVFGF